MSDITDLRRLWVARTRLSLLPAYKPNEDPVTATKRADLEAIIAELEPLEDDSAAPVADARLPYRDDD